nr:hypothetical protein [Tanacetum cinerariifolium]
MSPMIYTSCIKQFWTFAKVKTINEDVQLLALVDGKKVNVNEASIRRKLRLDDTEGTACLHNAAIIKELTRIGYEKPSQKLTFYKAFFSPQWKFLIHTIVQCLSAKTTAWNKFSSTMTSAIICLANNQIFKFSKYIFESMVKNLEAGVKFYMFPRIFQAFVNNQLGDMSHHKGIFVNPALTKKVFANMKKVEIAKTEKLKKRVKKLKGKKKKRTHGLKRMYKVGLSAMIVSSDKEGLDDQEDASKQGKIAKVDADEDNSLINENTKDQGRMNDQDIFRVNDLDGDEVVIDVLVR